MRCRIDFGQKKVHRQAASASQEVIAVGAAFFSAGTNLNPEDEIVFNGRRYTILSAKPCYDCLGNENHVEADIR